MRLLVKGGHVVDSTNDLDGPMDVLIEDGKVIAIDRELPGQDAEILDASGRVVLPGLVDMHVHLREPGREDEETIESGTLAAAAGGFTSVACMPNTSPPMDSQAVVRFMLDTARARGHVNVFPIGAITKGLSGVELSEIWDLREAGAVAISDDGEPVMNGELMRRAMEYAGMFGMCVIAHCEDSNLAADGVMNEGYMSTVLGLRGISRLAEEVMVVRDLLIAEEVKGRIHITHVSTARSVDMIRRAKLRGVSVTCDATPHHFTLTDEACAGYDTSTKVNPPLRTRQDVDALLEGLRDGTIDAIASDHAPHTIEEKYLEYDQAPFGLIGLETALPLAVMGLVDKGILTWTDLALKMSSNPARILGIDKGRIASGYDADLTIIDPNREIVVNVNSFRSKARNSPFHGWRLKGKVTHTIVGGKVVCEGD